jgi:hypothetical protein
MADESPDALESKPLTAREVQFVAAYALCGVAKAAEKRAGLHGRPRLRGW